MPVAAYEERRRLESLDRAALAQHQLARLNRQLAEILPANRFYADKLRGTRTHLESLDELRYWPLTTKQELIGGPATHDLVHNRTYPLERYVRFHQTSGTHGRPVIVLDTTQDWQWFTGCWQYVIDAAEIEAGERVLMAFSFGPFVGFWAAYDAFAARGCLVVPGGGMNTKARLELIRASRATVLCCTPSYALHLAEIGADHNIEVGKLGVERIVVAGEPGGSVPAVRQRIESLWNAKVADHAGATEVGPWGYGDLSGRGLHVMESEFIAEFLALDTGEPAGDGELAELVITNLGRYGCPVIRYRTGDLVRPTWRHKGPNRFVFLPGGVLGRADDMLIVRGVNVFPTSIEQIVRSFPDVIEYRLTVRKRGAMDHLAIEIEDRLNQPQRLADELSLRLNLAVEVQTVPAGTLPRFEGKGRRFVDLR